MEIAVEDRAVGLAPQVRRRLLTALLFCHRSWRLPGFNLRPRQTFSPSPPQAIVLRPASPAVPVGVSAFPGPGHPSRLRSGRSCRRRAARASEGNHACVDLYYRAAMRHGIILNRQTLPLPSSQPIGPRGSSISRAWPGSSQWARSMVVWTPEAIWSFGTKDVDSWSRLRTAASPGGPGDFCRLMPADTFEEKTLADTIGHPGWASALSRSA